VSKRRRSAPWPLQVCSGVAIVLGLVALSGCAGGPNNAGGNRGAGNTSSESTSPHASSSSGALVPASPTQAATPSPSTGPATPGSCHARGSGLYELPDPSCTPGATNPGVNQANIGRTICAAGWTDTVRPPESYTEPLKYRQVAAYGDAGPISSYEEDHLIPLELGGSPTSPLNLWPEPGASPNPKDAVESAANHAVCQGQMTLAAAQRAIAGDWTAFGRQLGVVEAATPSTLPRTGGGGTCTASASYSARYGDYDVFVHSDQPNQAVRVTASGGAVASWHTDTSGYADVYLHAPRTAAGQRLTVIVGTASCSTTL
jgi:hypothetical protein